MLPHLQKPDAVQNTGASQKPSEVQRRSMKQPKPVESQQQPNDREIVKATVYQSGPKPITEQQAQYRQNYRRKQVHHEIDIREHLFFM